MTDRELLELAAKAAGIDLEKINGPIVSEGNRLQDIWNPLTDDGDALRLAVKLNLQITFDSLSDGAIVKVSIPYDHPTLDSGYFWIVFLERDPYAATRRAIVRAAAEIGKGMK